MRCIKFRGKWIETDEWVYGSLLEEFHGRCFIVEPIQVHITTERTSKGKADAAIIGCYEVCSATVGQFIGLRDKKRTDEYPEGQEIWENDVVQFQRPHSMGHVVTKEVKYKEGRFLPFECLIPCGPNRQEKWRLRHTACEVIGDTHSNSNPDLIEKGTT